MADKAYIQQKTAQAVLEKPLTVKIGKDSYTMARPTLRTLINVSEEISKIPVFKAEKDRELSSAIAFAKHAGNMGNVLATMILGEKPAYKIMAKAVHSIRKKMLAEKLLAYYTPSELSLALTAIVVEMQIGDFFALTTSLNEINLIRTSGEVVTTVSGR